MASLRLQLDQLLLLARAEDLGRYFLDFRLQLLQSRLSTLPRGVGLCLLGDESLLLLAQIFELLLYLLHRRQVQWDIGLLRLPHFLQCVARLRAQVIEPPVGSLDVTDASY